ncbi:hypothetical protein BJ138DRAFT_1121868 [Hygrophoropsis aurantiaca]|uniref:Uncharacterized protein n=1 Tax=Hygrophoropsis aurantiaca TaxID=72124 RepID=A0ACB8ATY7_9AGAM|nr:hypothetical protein BJ138DRAFT_1121868 [Hygrophoropsis aurantiaca]
MALSPTVVDADMQSTSKWGSSDDQHLDNMGPLAADTSPGSPILVEEPGLDEQENAEQSSVNGSHSGAKNYTSEREKQAKPNKVYVGGLPDHTRQEDLQSCFGKIGKIVNIELKVGFGFVEFDTREAAQESVSKYHEGFFMGNKIRVEISHSRTRNTKHSSDPGACFKCGLTGHWARDCLGPSIQHHPRSGPSSDALIDRLHPPRGMPPRDYPSHRRDLGASGRYPPSRDARDSFDYRPPAVPADREYRRRASPPRDSRDHRSGRDYDDSRVRAAPAPAPSRYERPATHPAERNNHGPPRDYPPNRGDHYDRHDRRPPPIDDRPSHYPTGARTPPRQSIPRSREDYDRPPRDFAPPEHRGRPLTPPSRYADYPRRSSVEPRPRRSSASPPRSSAPYNSDGYARSGNYAGNGYSGSSGGRPRGRDYPRNGRDAPDSGSSYRRS